MAPQPPSVGVIARVILAAATAASVAAAAPPIAAPKLTGLWSAKIRYGPDIRGSLLLTRTSSGWRADIAGFSVQVVAHGRTLSFALPDRRASFRGTIDGAIIHGQWIQEPSFTGGVAYASPVALRRDQSGRWTGDVQPRQDTATYFLPLTPDQGGGYRTFLSNPERNQGRFDPIHRIELDGNSVRAIGGRTGQADHLLATGSWSPDDEMLMLPLHGSSVDFRRDERIASPFYARGREGERYRYSPPPALDDGWAVGSLESVGISRSAIEAFVQKLIDMKPEAGGSQIHSVLIARHGKLVLEEYFHGYSRDQTHDIRSAGKSFTSILIGAAMLNGVPIREDTPVYRTMLGQLPAQIDPRKWGMTLRHLLTMNSGFFCDDNNDEAPGNEDNIDQQTGDPTLYEFILGLPMDRTPGSRIVYCSGDALLAGGMLRKLSGEPLTDMFDRLVARPLQMSSYHLNLTPAGELYTAGGGYFRPRDFMKLPQMMLNGGTWNGRRIVSADWVRKSGAPLYDLSPQQQFGYFWNSAVYPWKGRKVRAVFAAGNGGQIAMEIPELDLVIAFNGGNYSEPALFIPQRVLVPEDILPAVN